MHYHTVCNHVHTQEPCIPTHIHFIILIFTAHPSYADVITWPAIPANLPKLKDHGLLSLLTFSTCFCTCRGSAPYAPLSHSSLSHTIYWISNSDSMTSYNPSTPFFYIIGHLVDCRGFLQVWFLLATPIPVSPCAPRYQTAWWPQTVFWCFSMRAKLGDKPEKPLWFCSW